MTQKSNDTNPLDPIAIFRSMRDAGMDSWSKIMIQVVNSDAYAQASSAMLDAWMTSSAPFRKVVEATMTQTLTQLNMPTRSDITVLAQRLTHIELRLDDLDAKLDEPRHAAPKAAPSKAKDAS
jgi:hypothetical protein